MTLKNYITGFVLSLACIAAPLVLFELHAANNHVWPTHTGIIIAALVFALLQCAVQLVYFLHLGRGRGSHEKLAVFGIAAGVLLILTMGSLWIMQNLSGRMMPTAEQMTQYMNNEQGI